MIAQISFSDSTGGAAIAARRLCAALVRAGIETSMLVARRDCTEQDPSIWVDPFGRPWTSLRAIVGAQIGRLMTTRIPTPQSFAFIPSLWPRRLNRSNAAIVHLHWIGGEMMSIEDIPRIDRPLVWTLHDMWAFCGAEHCAYDERWREGYTQKNRPDDEGGVDLNCWVFARKRRAWTRPIQIVAPSKWLGQCVSESALMCEWPVTVIPNPIDTDRYAPVDKLKARQRLKLPPNTKIIAFGVAGRSAPHHKGFDLLYAACDHLRARKLGFEALLIGLDRPDNADGFPIPAHYTGHLNEEELIMAYAAADCLVIPSRIDNLPNMGVESLACGRPIAAFDACGLPDIVTHRHTGWLAPSFNAPQLADGIIWIVEDRERLAKLEQAARADALARFSYPVVAEQYRKLYARILERPT